MAGTPTSSPTLHQILSRSHLRLVLFALVLASAMLLTSGVIAMRDYASKNLQLLARTVAYTVEPAIVFGDNQAIREGMISVANNDMVERLTVVDAHGSELASWNSLSDTLHPWLLDALPGFLKPNPVQTDIIRDNQLIARVHVQGNPAGIVRFVGAGLLIASCSIGIALVATSIMGNKLRSGVLGPLRIAVDVARSARVERAFNRKVPAAGVAEVDHFVEDFNLLLAELNGWYQGLTEENRELARQASHDVLTGLGNRNLFEGRFGEAVARGQRDGTSFGLLYLDGNQFKQINDCHGHDAGDEVLRAVAGRLQATIRGADAAFRLGGDEFAVLLAPPITRDEISSLVARIDRAMDALIPLPGGGVISTSLSIGSAFYPEDGTTAAELLKKADHEMYRRKPGRVQ